MAERSTKGFANRATYKLDAEALHRYFSKVHIEYYLHHRTENSPLQTFASATPCKFGGMILAVKILARKISVAG